MIIKRVSHGLTYSSLEKGNRKRCGPYFGAAKRETLRTERPVLPEPEVFVATGSVPRVNLQAVLTIA